MYIKLLKHYLRKTLFIPITILALVPFFTITILDGDTIITILFSSYFVYFCYCIITSTDHKMFSFLPVDRKKVILADYSAYIIQLLFSCLVVLVTFYLLKLTMTNPNLTSMKLSLGSLIATAFSMSLIAKCVYDFISSPVKRAIISFIAYFVGFLSISLGSLFFAKFTGYSANYVIYPASFIIITLIFLITKRYFPRLDL